MSVKGFGFKVKVHVHKGFQGTGSCKDGLDPECKIPYLRNMDL